LSQQIEENNEPVLTSFQELQDLVALLKADLTSVLGITITYQDNDGD
jgi:predicted lipoprotein